MKVKRYGLIRDLPDCRDFMFSITAPRVLPPKVDLRETGNCPPVWDQGQLGSCTGHGVGFLYAFAHKAQGLGDFMPSRLFIYYNERVMEHTVRSDAGAQIRDGVKSLSKVGVATEALWPYKISKFANKPPVKAFNEAKKHTAVKYQRLTRTTDLLRGCLADGRPFTFGFTVYDSFESDEVARTGIVPMPSKTEQALGGHCVAVCGYDDQTQMFICRNSWGAGWGDGGYFYLPYAYVLDGGLSGDFWMLELIR